ncbi:MAG: LysR family transcriptional regulator [Bacteriovoracaceae bacterium]|nr:LysR family transcriptional regulator [Bacteriovoracaceae bacterium]
MHHKLLKPGSIMDFNSARMFVSVVSKGSFTSAAKELGVPVATVSRRIAELEESLNLRLLERSTRNLRVTEAGSTLYEFASRGVEEFEAGLLAITDKEDELHGVLRISMPPSFEPLWDLLKKFQNQYQKIDIEVFVSERRVNYIEDGIDLSLRVGSIDTLSGVARKITTYRHKLIASSKYSNTKIKNPNDLLSHHCILWGTKSSNREWRLGSQTIKIQPKIIANDYALIQSLVHSGGYISEVPPFLCRKGLEDGTLKEVLPQYPMPELDINLVYPSKKNISRISRVFIDFCLENSEKFNS